jgi:hypothetical protein
MAVPLSKCAQHSYQKDIFLQKSGITVSIPRMAGLFIFFANIPKFSTSFIFPLDPG